MLSRPSVSACKGTVLPNAWLSSAVNTALPNVGISCHVDGADGLRQMIGRPCVDILKPKTIDRHNVADMLSNDKLSQSGRRCAYYCWSWCVLVCAAHMTGESRLDVSMLAAQGRVLCQVILNPMSGILGQTVGCPSEGAIVSNP